MGILKLPMARDEDHKKWRVDWLAQITQITRREVDEEFKPQAEGDRAFTCEKHFNFEDIETFK